MREIKFRAWHKEEKIIGEVLGIDILHKEIFFSNEDVDCYEHSDFKDIELMQYTGLKDKNNKEIYEGDIIKFCNKIWEVVCDYEDAHLFYLRTIGDPYIAENMSKFTRGEVIGNIHDNPELLKQ